MVLPKFQLLILLSVGTLQMNDEEWRKRYHDIIFPLDLFESVSA